MAGVRAADTGIDAPTPIGPFLDGVFPSRTPGGSGGWSYERVFSGVSPAMATCAVAYPGTNKILVVEKQGRIVTFENSPDVNTMQVFLDLRLQTYDNSDSGMFALVFHPEFGQPGSPNRGYVYVTYKYSPLDDLGDFGFFRLSRFTVPDGETTADPASEQILIQAFDRHPWHEGGFMMFGADGFLYLSRGDEGAGNDAFDVTQGITDRLFSGILRIDVDRDLTRSHPIRRQPRALPVPEGWPLAFTANYTIPNDNPWVNENGGNLEEFYAIGLRSPYRFSRDPVSGRVWIGDVGQDAREEISELAKGANFEWAYKEGTFPGPKPQPAFILGTPTPPVWDYGRDQGFCVILGPFYYGDEHPTLQGKCLVSDYVSGKVWAITPASGDKSLKVETLFTISSPGIGTTGTTAFLELPDGEVLIVKHNAQYQTEFFKIARTGVTTPNPPALLSQTGVFTNLATLTPRPGLIPYSVNAPLWSDAALKKRWIAIPNDGNPDSAAEKIAFAPESEWKFPPGTVLVKHFELATDETNPTAIRRLETRFLVISSTGDPYGVTYRWRADGSDADLLRSSTANATSNITIKQADGSNRTQTWSYPNRSSCMTCHNAAAKFVLGVRTHQLNGDIIYPATGRTANQLATLNHLGFFDSAYRPEHQQYFLKSVALSDLAAPLETRVRSYIDSNCSQCHRPGGVRANFDARFTTPLESQNLIRGKVQTPFLGGDEAVIQPGDALHSVALQRVGKIGAGQMPPIGKSIVDASAQQTIMQWIESLSYGPTVSLSRDGFDENGDARVAVKFSAPVEDFAINDVSVRGGQAVSIEGSGADYIAHLKFLSGAPITVRIPGGAASANAIGNYASSSLSIIPVQPNLVTWLKLDEAGSDSVENVVFPLSSGTISGDTAPIDGYIDGARQFNGGRVSIPNSLGDDFTISFWIKADAPFPETNLAIQGSTIFFSDAASASEECLISGTRDASGANILNFQTGSDSSGNRATLRSELPITIERWTHVAVTRVRSTHQMIVHLNGQFCGQAIEQSENLGGASTNEIGGSTDGSYPSFAGAIDQFRIFSRALSANEIQALAAETVDSTRSQVERWFAMSMPGLSHLQDTSLDPDADGRSNFYEFAFGTNPLGNDNYFMSLDVSDENISSLVFPVRKGDSGISYNVEVSFDLQAWQPAGDRLTVSFDAPLDGSDYLMRSAIFAPSSEDFAQKAFFRVVPTGNPK